MENINKPDAILTGDLHIRETQPICRLDDFVNKTQWEDLQFLKDLQEKYRCPVLCGGDVFHYWKPSPWLITKTLQYIPDEFYSVLGQHDLKNHSYELKDQCGLVTLNENPKVEILRGLHWGQNEDPKDFDDSDGSDNFLVMHRFAWDGENIPWPNCEELTAEQILDKFPQYDLITTSDHHKGFYYEKDGRLLVNPGCFNIQDAKYIDYNPRIYLWDSKTNTVEPIYLPNNGQYSREHRDRDKQHRQKMDAFIQWVREDIEKSFGDSQEDEVLDMLEQFFKKHKTQQSVKQLIYKAMESET